MKGLIVVFVLALAISCLAQTAYVPGYPWRAGVMNVQDPGPQGIRREEPSMPEVQVIDGFRPIQYQSRAVDASGRDQIEFPMQSTNQ